MAGFLRSKIPAEFSTQRNHSRDRYMQFKKSMLMKNFLTVISLFIFLIGKAQTTISDEKSTEIDNYIEIVMSDQKIPGLALAITYNGKVLKKRDLWFGKY